MIKKTLSQWILPYRALPQGTVLAGSTQNGDDIPKPWMIGEFLALIIQTNHTLGAIPGAFAPVITIQGKLVDGGTYEAFKDPDGNDLVVDPKVFDPDSQLDVEGVVVSTLNLRNLQTPAGKTLADYSAIRVTAADPGTAGLEMSILAMVYGLSYAPGDLPLGTRVIQDGLAHRTNFVKKAAADMGIEFHPGQLRDV